MRNTGWKRAALAVCLVFVSAPAGVSQVAGELVDLDAVAAIRSEGLENSHMQQLAHHLTDVIGPRLTGSPGMREANDWTASMFSEWGLTNVTVEPWGEFGRGWREVSYAGRMVSMLQRRQLPVMLSRCPAECIDSGILSFVQVSQSK